SRRQCRGVAQPGSALAWGASGRWFKSSRPDQWRPLISLACAKGIRGLTFWVGAGWQQIGSKGRVKRDHGRRRALGQGTEVERLETVTQVVQVEVAVDLGSDLGVGVAEDPLHDRERHLRLEEQRGRCVAQVV